MSFGKDNKYLDTMPVYGGSYTQKAAYAGRKKQRDYGNKRPYWIDGFRPSETQDSNIRLIPGDYEITRADEKNNLYTEKVSHFEYVEHYSGRVKRGGICSGGPLFFRKDLRDTCYGCDQRDGEGRMGKNQRPVMSRSEKFVITVIDMGLFHQVPQIDRQTNQIRFKPDSTEPYTEWAKCTSRGCKNCQMTIQNKYGYIQPWSMPKAHFNTLNSYGPGISSCCVTCGSRGTIRSLAWRCSNAQCQTMIFDMTTTTATDEQISEVVNAPFHCRTCKQVAYPEEVFQCQNCTPYGRQPIRATIFDVDMLVRTLRTGDGDATVLQITGMSNPQPLHSHFAELLQYKPDLSKKFSPTPLDVQERLWDVRPKAQPATPPPGAPPPQGYAPPTGYAPPQQYTQPYGQAPVQQPVLPGAQWAPQPQPHPAPAPQSNQPGYALQPPAGPPVTYNPPYGGQQ